MALAELAGEVWEGRLALAVGAGLQVMAAIMEEDVTAVCGPRLRALRDTLEGVTQPVGATRHDKNTKPPDDHWDAAEIPRNSGHPRGTPRRG